MNDSTIESSTRNLERLYGQSQEETKREQPSPISPEKARLIQGILDKFLSWGYLSDPLAVRDWANGIADIDEDSLREGFKRAKDFTGYLKLGDFREMCKKPRTHASYRRFQALPNKPMEKDALRSKLAKMREELGV